ncbi:hypothetical protein UY3_16083 [Chelonia mydas]|uniref:Myb/SANT-like DNA-binding domain-containing protein n=1 Tax=Chelonia mydas TaxID=8469 RepID=M7AQG8_CHEMY|nr:hypothetical protein UY3_16083 [Chelonia mydas]
MMESQNRKRAPAWTEWEVRDLIAVWGEESMLSELRSSFRNAKTFVKISQGMKDRGHNRDPKQCRVKVKELGGSATITPTVCFDSVNGEGGNTEAGFGDKEDDDEVVDSSQQASGETGFPDSQELFLTLDLERVPPEPTQGWLLDPPGGEGISVMEPTRTRHSATRVDQVCECRLPVRAAVPAPASAGEPGHSSSLYADGQRRGAKVAAVSQGSWCVCVSLIQALEASRTHSGSMTVELLGSIREIEEPAALDEGASSFQLPSPQKLNEQNFHGKLCLNPITSLLSYSVSFRKASSLDFKDFNHIPRIIVDNSTSLLVTQAHQLSILFSSDLCTSSSLGYISS